MLLLQLLNTIGQLQQVRLLPKPICKLEVDSAAMISTTVNDQQSHTCSPSDNLLIDEPHHLCSTGKMPPAKFQLQSKELTPCSASVFDDKQSSR